MQQLFSTGALLAPMLTTTDISFRSVCRSFGAGLTCTEMVSAKGIDEKTMESYRNAVFDPDERPIAIQLAAANPETMTQAVQQLAVLKPTVFDINCGCPNPRVCEAGAGSSLLDDPGLLGRVVEAAVRASGIPVSVKIRSRGLRSNLPIEDTVRIIENSGASYLTVHARPRKRPYDQPADWDTISRVKASANIPVVGNGDIYCAADAIEMKRQTGCDAVMVGRGCLGTPWIFKGIAENRASGLVDDAPDPENFRLLVLNHLAMLRKEFGDFRCIPRMRKNLLWYLRHYARLEEFRTSIFSREDASFILEESDRFLSAEEEKFEAGSEQFEHREALFLKRVLYWTTSLQEDTSIC